MERPAPPKGESGIATIVRPGEWYATFLQNGKQVRVIHSVVSKDGKTVRNTEKGVDAKRQTIRNFACARQAIESNLCDILD